MNLKSLRRFHIYLGVGLTIPLLIIIITGTYLGLTESPPRPQERPLSQLSSLSIVNEIENFFRSHPTSRIKAIHLKSDGIQILDSNSKQDQVNWILKVHRGSVAGLPGKIFASGIGVFAFLLWPSGFILRLRRPKPKSKRVQTNNAFGYHRKLGFFFGALFSGTALIGSLINFNQKLFEIFDPIPTTPLLNPVEPQKREPHLFASQIIEDMIRAQKTRPGSQLRSIYFLSSDQANSLYYFTDNSSVYINQETHQIEKIITPGSKWIHSLYPIHSGKIFGPWSIAFILTVGLTSIFSIITGLVTANQAAWISIFPRK